MMMLPSNDSMILLSNMIRPIISQWNFQTNDLTDISSTAQPIPFVNTDFINFIIPEWVGYPSKNHYHCKNLRTRRSIRIMTRLSSDPLVQITHSTSGPLIIILLHSQTLVMRPLPGSSPEGVRRSRERAYKKTFHKPLYDPTPFTGCAYLPETQSFYVTTQQRLYQFHPENQEHPFELLHDFLENPQGLSAIPIQCIVSEEYPGKTGLLIGKGHRAFYWDAQQQRMMISTTLDQSTVIYRIIPTTTPFLYIEYLRYPVDGNQPGDHADDEDPTLEIACFTSGSSSSGGAGPEGPKKPGGVKPGSAKPGSVKPGGAKPGGAVAKKVVKKMTRLKS
jgi:hypothetical protein